MARSTSTHPHRPPRAARTGGQANESERARRSPTCGGQHAHDGIQAAVREDPAERNGKAGPAAADDDE